jgi:hypothetical protein
MLITRLPPKVIFLLSSIRMAKALLSECTQANLRWQDLGIYIRPQVDIDPHVFELTPQEQLPCLHLQIGEKAVQERAKIGGCDKGTYLAHLLVLSPWGGPK